jgi:uncharacterized membrane protein
LKGGIMVRLRRYLVAGLLVWVPAMVTVLVLRFLVRILDQTLKLLPPKYQPEVWLGFNIPGLGIVLTLVVLLVTGMFVANFVDRALLEGWESLLGRIPLIRTLYSGVKQVAEHLFDENGKPFKQVVLVEYPRRGMWSLGFLTSERTGEPHARTEEPQLVSVFVPTTPNPTSGFLVMTPRNDVLMLDMKVDDAMKMIISMGVVIPAWKEQLARLGDEIRPSGGPDDAGGGGPRPSEAALRRAVEAAAADLEGGRRTGEGGGRGGDAPEKAAGGDLARRGSSS